MRLSASNQYFIGIVNIVAASLLAAILGLLLILQIKAYEIHVSYTFSWRFFLFDPFASRLIFLCLVAMIVNLISATLALSGMYPLNIITNGVIFAMSSILWIVLYLGTDYTFERPAILPFILMVLGLIGLISQQLKRWRMRFLLFFCSGLIVLLPILGRVTDMQSRENLPSRQLIE